MSSDSSQLSHSPLSGAEPLDLPQRLSQYVEPVSQPVVIPDSLPDSRGALDDNVMKLTPSTQDVIPESPPLSLDEQRAANMARNVSVARALGLRPRPESPVKQPAHRVRASWKCTPKCGQSFTKSEDLVNHLREVHQKGNNVFDLAPIGFGACPYCRGIFCALRGWRNHVMSCKAPRRPLTDIFPVQLPQSCLGMKKITDGTRGKFSQPPRRLSHPGMLSMRMRGWKLRGVTGSTSNSLVRLLNPPALSVCLRSVRGVTCRRHEHTNLHTMMETTNTRIHREVWRNAG